MLDCLILYFHSRKDLISRNTDNNIYLHTNTGLMSVETNLQC